MELTNQVMLITYADSLGKDLKELKALLDGPLRGAVGGVHILPFFPSSADRGFAPMTYREVDPEFGGWADVEALGRDHPLMFDYMINHISRQSEYCKDFLRQKDASPYKDLFLRYKDFWPGGEPTQEQIDQIYKRKPRAPYSEVTFADGTREKLWCTFDEEQLDLNCAHPFTRAWIQENLRFLAGKSASVIRLDAFAYAAKKPDTSCFFLEPEIWDLLELCADTLAPYGCALLPEIHEHYTMQLKVAEKGYYVYDFALPMLLLHGLYTGRADRLAHWMTICPRKQFTTLDTHDGIGVVDAKDLMTDEEIALTRDRLYAQGGSVNRKYSSADYNNLDIYQINCTYYSALGCDDDAYLTARAVQLFAPGIPQVYYVGLLAGRNDVERVEKTRTGRDINRHSFSAGEVQTETERPVVQKLLALLRLRNTHPAFGGSVSVSGGEDGRLTLLWENGDQSARLTADLGAKSFSIQATDDHGALCPVVI